jgi:hypothetical protein
MAFGKPFPPFPLSLEIDKIIYMSERMAKGQSQSGDGNATVTGTLFLFP